VGAQPGQRWDFDAELMHQFQHAHNERRRNCANGRQQHNAQAEIPVPAPAANSNVFADAQHGQFNAQFHQHIINFEAETEVQNDGALHAEQARREELQRDLLSQQQVAQQQMLNVQLELAQRSYAHQE